MRRVQHGTPITDFGGRKQISFDALFSSDSEEEAAPTRCLTSHSPVKAQSMDEQVQPSQTKAPPSPDFPYRREDDPISVWTQKVTESFEKASRKQLPPDFKESLGRLSFFRKAAPVPAQQPQEPLISKE